MTQDELKRAAAHAAIDYIVDGSIVGVGMPRARLSGGAAAAIAR